MSVEKCMIEESVNLSPSIINEYLGRSNVSSIDKIMTREEEETASEEARKYTERMKLYCDA